MKRARRAAPMQRLDKEHELLDAEVDQLRVVLDEVGSAHPEKIARLRTTVGQLRKVLVAEIEYCRMEPFVGGYG